MSVEPTRDDGNGDPSVSPSPDRMVGDLIERIIEKLPTRTASLLRQGAVPHRLDKELLLRLAGDEEFAEDISGVLSRLSLVWHDESGTFLYHTQLRDYLRRSLAITDPAEFLATNRICYEYFIAAATHSESLDRFGNECESIYHLFQIDSPAATSQLIRRCDELAADGQWAYIEQLLRQGVELVSSLDTSSVLWLRYWQARVSLAQRFVAAAETEFEQLRTMLAQGEQADAVLAAYVAQGLGQVCVAQGRWGDGIALHRQSLKQLGRHGDVRAVASGELALGFAYWDLAEKCGGASTNQSSQDLTAHSAWDAFARLPLTAYEYLARFAGWLPHLYANSDYQDWIIFYLWRQALKWFGRAERSAERGQIENIRQEAVHMQARLDHRLGRFGQAERRYEALLAMPSVQASLYRQSRVTLGLGLVRLGQKRLAEAEPLLRDATSTLLKFRDFAHAGVGLRRLGDLYAQSGRAEDAVTSYRESIDAFIALGDDLEVTTSVVALERFTRLLGNARSSEYNATVVESVTHLAYLARFPDRLLRRFRRISLLLALPAAYFVALFFGFLGVFSLFLLEGGIVLLRAGEPFNLTIVPSVLIFGLSLVVGISTLWLQKIFYTFIGLAVVHSMGRKLGEIEQAQPDCIRVSKFGLSVSRGASEMMILEWADIQRIVPIEYRRWKTLIELFSSLQVVDKDRQSLNIPATTNHFDHLLGQTFAQTNAQVRVADFRIVRSGWMGVAILASLLISLITIFAGSLLGGELLVIQRQVAEGRHLAILWTTSVTFFFVPTAFALLPAVFLLRLAVFQTRLRISTGLRGSALSALSLWSLALCAWIIAILWILLLVNLASIAAQYR